MAIKTTDRIYIPEFFSTPERCVQWFDESLSNMILHYSSTKDCIIIGYGTQVEYEHILKAIEILKSRGLNVEFKNSYCGHGPFKSIAFYA